MFVITDKEETGLLSLIEARSAPSSETLAVVNSIYTRLVEQRAVREGFKAMTQRRSTPPPRAS